MRVTKLLLTATIATLAVLMLPTSAAAHHTGGGQSGTNPNGTGFLVAWAGGRDFTPGGHGSGCSYDTAAHDWPTVYAQLNSMNQAGPIPDDLGTQLDSQGRHFWTGTYEGVEHYYSYQDCSGPANLVWLPVLTGTNLGTWAFDELLRNIPIPDPYFHPYDVGGPWLYTQVPTDYRLQSLYTYQARATALGAYVEATAVPREVIFELTDVGRVIDSTGTEVAAVTCPALQSVAAYDPATPGACSLTFLDSSSISGDSDFDYDITVVWDVTFAGVGVAGPLPPPTTITTFTTGESVRVGEARPST